MRASAKRNRIPAADADLEAWIAQYGDGLLRLCILQIGDYGLAEDAVQETFVRAWRAYGEFEHRSSVKTWLTTIAVNVCRSMRRGQSRRSAVPLDQMPELMTFDGEMRDYTVSQAVMKLPPDMREVVLMHELQGMKIREIAQARRLPVATVSSRLRRAKEKLREELKGWYFDEA